MASAWGKSWGAAFGVAFGAIASAPTATPPEPPKYYAVEQKKSEGELLMVQALEEDEILLSMLHVLVEEL